MFYILKMECKYCGSAKSVKNGYVKSKQRYKCKDCGRNYTEGDKRSSYDDSTKLRCLRYYLEGVGIRSISRVEGVSPPTILRWIRKFSEVVKKAISSIPVPEEASEIQILEVDELFSYVEKKVTKSTYGLLLIGSEAKLLISK